MRKTTIDCIENCRYNNLSLSRIVARVFSLKSTPLRIWVMWVYIVCVETWSAICLIASTKTWLLLMLLNNTKTSLNTQNGCGKCLGYQPLKDLEMERQDLRKITMDCIENCGYNSLSLSRIVARVFSLKSTPLRIWVM